MFLIDGKAFCVDCEWKTAGKNALGNGAQHYQRTSHYVQCELYYGHSFGTRPVPATLAGIPKEEGGE